MFIWRNGTQQLENFSRLDKNQKMNMTNLQLHSKNGMLLLNIYQQEKLEVTRKKVKVGDGEGL